MSTATTLLASMFVVSMCAAGQTEAAPVFACNLKAISASERPRYKQLVERVRHAIRSRSEISGGYVFKLDGKAVSLPEAAEWISMERRCCPFLTLQLSASGDQEHWVLTLTGPQGVKTLLNAEFPAP
jgi:hypothetical protein